MIDDHMAAGGPRIIVPVTWDSATVAAGLQPAPVTAAPAEHIESVIDEGHVPKAHEAADIFARVKRLKGILRIFYAVTGYNEGDVERG